MKKKGKIPKRKGKNIGKSRARRKRKRGNMKEKAVNLTNHAAKKNVRGKRRKEMKRKDKK